MLDKEEGTLAEVVMVEHETSDELATHRQWGDGVTAMEEDGHHLLEEASMYVANGEGGNGGAGMLIDVFF